jgi:predicted thioredoxin/glutaredoxin
MLQMNLITQEELCADLYEKVYGELYGELYEELYEELYWGLYRELYWEVRGTLGSQIRAEFLHSKISRV